MAKNSKLCFFIFCTTLLLFIPILFAAPNTPVPPSVICKSTPYPSFCKSSVLPPSESPDNENVYSYGRKSIRKSLSSARKFLSLIEKYLRKSKQLTVTAVRALEDCQFLAGLNMDYLSSSLKTVNATSNILPVLQADDVQTLLSAILTNTQTCLDGLQETSSAWSLRNGLVAPLSNDTKLFSVSLALFTKGWVPIKKNKSKFHRVKKNIFKNGRLPLKMSQRNQAIFERVGRRKLLQEDEQVVVSDIVVVSQDGSGNFSTINDAVAAAPNNTKAESGYFLIYITQGVYEEYVSIAKNKKYLMMIGDGINQTIITGNHSFVDGWTTFNSSTFCKYLLSFTSQKLMNHVNQ